MPAFVAPLIGFTLGVVLAWMSAPSLHRPPSASGWVFPLPAGSPWDFGRIPRALGGTRGTARPARSEPLQPQGRPMALATLFSALVFTPICAYFLVFSPDWSFAYLVDTRRIPSAIDLLLLVVDAASVPAGLAMGVRFAERRSLRASALLAGAPLGVALLAVLVLARRLSLDGTYRQVQGDFGTHPVAGGPLGVALLWMNAMLTAGFVITARALLTRPGEGRNPAQPATPPPTAAGDLERAEIEPSGPSTRPDEPEGAAAAPASAPPLRRLGAGRSASSRSRRPGGT